MWCAVKLSDIHDVVLILEDCRLVVIDIEVVGGGEDSHDGWESGGACLSVHAVTGVLCLVGADDGKEVVLLEEVAGGWVGEEVGASAYVVVHEVLGCLLLAELFEWVGPEDVAHESLGWWLAETVDLEFVNICLV